MAGQHLHWQNLPSILVLCFITPFCRELASTSSSLLCHWVPPTSSASSSAQQQRSNILTEQQYSYRTAGMQRSSSVPSAQILLQKQHTRAWYLVVGNEAPFFSLLWDVGNWQTLPVSCSSVDFNLTQNINDNHSTAEATGQQQQQ